VHGFRLFCITFRMYNSLWSLTWKGGKLEGPRGMEWNVLDTHCWPPCVRILTYRHLYHCPLALHLVHLNAVRLIFGEIPMSISTINPSPPSQTYSHRRWTLIGVANGVLVLEDWGIQAATSMFRQSSGQSINCRFPASAMAGDERYNINIMWKTVDPTPPWTLNPPHCLWPTLRRSGHLFRAAVISEFGNCKL